MDQAEDRLRGCGMYRVSSVVCALSRVLTRVSERRREVSDNGCLWHFDLYIVYLAWDLIYFLKSEYSGLCGWRESKLNYGAVICFL